MTGKYDMILYNNRVHYHLTIERNLTVLRGDSAAGKSELIRLLTVHNNNPQTSGITLICEKECMVLTDGTWELFMKSFPDRIFFIDEGNSFLRTKKFAEAVQGADNYFVIISRESLPQLPYSVNEIYGLKEGNEFGKYREPRRVYNEMYRIYGTNMDSESLPELVITEDSNSGHEFFDMIFPGKCQSAHGKSNIKRLLAESAGKTVLAVVDGAAFGPEMQACMELAGTVDSRITLFAPESFEYLILESGLLNVPRAVLEETWDYADSASYMSWEEFYTAYLSEKSRNEVYQYSKRKLNNYYKTQGSIERIKKLLPENIRKMSE